MSCIHSMISLNLKAYLQELFKRCGFRFRVPIPGPGSRVPGPGSRLQRKHYKSPPGWLKYCYKITFLRVKTQITDKCRSIILYKELLQSPIRPSLKWPPPLCLRLPYLIVLGYYLTKRKKKEKETVWFIYFSNTLILYVEPIFSTPHPTLPKHSALYIKNAEIFLKQAWNIYTISIYINLIQY